MGCFGSAHDLIRTRMRNAEGDIFPNRPLLEQGQQSVRRHQDDAGCYSIRRVAESQFLPVREDPAFVTNDLRLANEWSQKAKEVRQQPKPPDN